jgi:hypothetical protein
MDGIRLDHLDPGAVREVSPAIGSWLMAEGHAVLEMRNLTHNDQRDHSHEKTAPRVEGQATRRPRSASRVTLTPPLVAARSC